MSKKRIILDTDMGADCDDAGAMAVLHYLADRGEAELLAVIFSSGRMPWGVGVCAAINSFCGRPDIPLGAYQQTDVGDPADKLFSEDIARDTARHGHGVRQTSEAEDALKVYRRTLAAQPDHSVQLVTIGHLKAVADLLQSGPDEFSPLNGKDLVAAKIDELVVMGGQFPRSGEHPEWNFGANDSAPSTLAVLQHWPGRVVYSGFEIGIRIKTGQPYNSGYETNPIAQAYRGFHRWHKEDLALGRPSWDQTAALYAVRGLAHAGETYWRLSEPGQIHLDEKGGNTWSDSSTGQHFYLIEAMPPERLEKVIQDMMLAVPRSS